MAGIRHHFIPQFLQRGFKSHSNGDEHFTWVHRKGAAKPFNTNIKNSALERQFYSQDGDGSVDDAITDAEGALAAFVAGLRGLPEGASVESDRAAELINHLLIRTRHLRQNFQDLTGLFVHGAYGAMSDPARLPTVLIDHIQVDGNLERIARRLLTDVLSKTVPANLLERAVADLLPSIVQWAKEQLPKDFVRDAAQMAKQIEEEGAIAASLLPEGIKTAHLKSLRSPGTPTRRQLEFAALTYCIRKHTAGDLILGDSAIVLAVRGERKVAPLSDGNSPMIGVLLPLDPHTSLVGNSGEPSEALSTDEGVRRAIVECSKEFFIAHAETADNTRLADDLGKNSHLLNGADAADVLRGLGLG